MKGFTVSKLIILLIFVGCGSQGWSNEKDPWESLNRKVFVFNDTADRYVVKPIAKSYQWVTPDIVETGIGNVFSNLGEVSTVANDVLQLKAKQAGKDLSRFLINSTIGVVGIFDVASKLGFEKNTQDFGLTLASWGVNSGPYVVVPFLGPSTIRDGVGSIVEGYGNLVTEHVDYVPTRNTITAVNLVDTRASLLDAESLISGDRYTFLRDAYLQRREALVNGGVTEDNFGEEDFEDFDE